MNISVKWLNRYLDPSDISAEEAERVLTHAGFPLEGFLDTAGAGGAGDTGLDLEVTSNRGDCLSHVGMAREIAACSGYKLVYPTWDEPAREGAVGEAITLENREPGVCPLFTAQVIKGVKVGPSPAWLVEALESIGQRSINNVVDVTNFLTFELGQPAHVFDLDKLAGDELVIRFAEEGEHLTTLDGKGRTLKKTDLVVADAERAQSLAGVIGGADSEVSDSTTNVVLEAATWDPVTIRTAARRMAIRTDACHRFERIVDPRTIDFATRRAAALIAGLTGGTLCDGILTEGRPLEEPLTIRLRPQRARDLIGVAIDDEEMAGLLTGLEIDVARKGDALACTIPAHRPDLTREVDLIEEVARTKGYDAIPIEERISVVVKHPQESERAMRELRGVLTGLGFYETVTFSFTSPTVAELFLDDGVSPLAVDDERRKAEPTLRPSVLPGLLGCRKANQDAGVQVEGGVRLFETSAVFGERDGASTEHRVVTLIQDVEGVGRGKKAKPEQIQRAVRRIRGAAEALTRALTGKDCSLSPTEAAGNGMATSADVALDGESIGRLGLVSDAALQAFGLDAPVVAAELHLDPIVSRYPPAAAVCELPAHPAIDRDVSLVVDESVAWSRVASLIEESQLALLDGFAFVGAYRGKQVGAGKKSVTLRLRFRDAERTLRHEEVEPQVNTFVGAAEKNLGATVRG